MIQFPSINPTALSIGPFNIQWYGLAYLAGIILATLFAKKRLMALGLSMDNVYDWVSNAVLGMLIGGRLGYILFYNLSFYLENPLKVFAVWEGGMSYHGGAIGAVLGVIYFCYKTNSHYLSCLDIVSISSCFGIGLGRIANFINGELYGRVTAMPWGIVFPNGGLDPRHPSQLYEAFLEGLLMFFVLYIILEKIRVKPGYTFCWYIVLYATARFFIEFVREPDKQIGLFFNFLTMGQLLCISSILFGLGVMHYLFHHVHKRS